jgi:mannose-6-phosphate isomerase-like protein (cupin superfamily)
VGVALSSLDRQGDCRMSAEEIEFPYTPPLPERTPEMVLATRDMFQDATADSFRSLPGFEAAEIRECDIGKVAAGDVRVSVLRAKPGYKWVGSPWHMHHYNFSVTYVLKGWADFEFEGVGKLRLGAGTVMDQPALNRHREGEMSEDFEAVVFHSPAVFGTTAFLYNEETGEYVDQYIGEVANDVQFGESLEVVAN